MALTTVATLVEMTAVYACVNAIQILTQTKNSVTYSFLLQLDSCMYMIEIFLSLSMHKKRKEHIMKHAKNIFKGDFLKSAPNKK